MPVTYAKYTLSPSKAILKDGHTMFPQDIVRDLNRKSYLEKRVKEIEDTRLHIAAAALDSDEKTT